MKIKRLLNLWLRLGLLGTLALTGLLGGFTARTQQTDAQKEPEAPPLKTDAPAEPENKVEPDSQHFEHVQRTSHDYVRVFEDGTLEAGESVLSFVVIFGNGTMNGHVERDMVVVGGTAQVNGTVGHDLVVILGNAKLGPKAKVGRETVVVLGDLDKAPGAKLARKAFGLSLEKWRRFLDPAWQWCKSGLLLGRPLPPRLPWVWWVAGLFFLIYLIIAFLAPRPVGACVQVLDSKSVPAFFIGLLALIALMPLLLLLTSLVVGLLVVPFLCCGIVAAIFVGKTAVFQHLGLRVFRRFNPATSVNGLVAFVVGSAVVTLLYMVPLLGLLVWMLLVPLGLGAVLIVVFGAFRRDGKNGGAKAPPGPAGVAPAWAAPAGGAPAGNAGIMGGSSPLAVPPVISPVGASFAGAAAAVPPIEFAVMPRVGFWLRFAASLVDFMLFVFLFWIVPHAPLLAWFLHATTPFFFILWLTYHVAMWTWKGTTIGGMVCKLKVVRTDGSPVDFGVALVRALAGVISFMAAGLGFFWAGWTREKQSWHDQIAGTIIVKLPRGMSLI
jgi:uncharacterized RDD family membrane protein YckC